MDELDIHNQRALRRLSIAAFLTVALGLGVVALVACSAQLAPAAREAAVKAGLVEADARCQAWLGANPRKTPDNSVLWETCYVLQNSDQAIVLLEEALSGRGAPAPEPSDAGLNPTPGNSVRSVP